MTDPRWRQKKTKKKAEGRCQHRRWMRMIAAPWRVWAMAGNSSGPLFVWQHAAPSNGSRNHSVYIALLYMEKVKRANSGNSRQNGQNNSTGVENSQNYLNELPVKEPHYLGVRLTWEKKSVMHWWKLTVMWKLPLVQIQCLLTGVCKTKWRKVGVTLLRTSNETRIHKLAKDLPPYQTPFASSVIRNYTC